MGTACECGRVAWVMRLLWVWAVWVCAVWVRGGCGPWVWACLVGYGGCVVWLWVCGEGVGCARVSARVRAGVGACMRVWMCGEGKGGGPWP